MKKKILVLIKQPPYGNSLAKDGLDFVLTSAAYEQDLSVVFVSDGVWQLLKDQNGKTIDQKTLSGALEVLPLYDVEQIFVVQEDLSERKIANDDLCIEVTPINRAQLSAMLDQQDSVIGF